MLRFIIVQFAKDMSQLKWTTDSGLCFIYKLMHKHNVTDYTTAQTQE